MNIESIREYCLSLPLATEDMAFGEGHLLFRIFNKIFACLSIDGDDYLALKCDPEYAIELRERNSGIKPAFHWNKKYWNQVSPSRMYDTDLLTSLIRHSYSECVKKLPKKTRMAFPEISTING